jgi:outer membrane protein
MRRWLALLFPLIALFVSTNAFAGKIAVVDFERAVTETKEGKAAQERLDTMYASRKEEIQKLQDDLQKDMDDYQSRSMILSDDAKAEAEKKLQAKQQTFQDTYQRYQSEMQQTYQTLLQDLDEKMRKLTQEIAKEQGYDLVIDKAAVVYTGGDTVDMTDLLIKKYDESQD